jgi:Cyclophilin type peptidyl-prolyl cis-trans isomerase/CLD
MARAENQSMEKSSPTKTLHCVTKEKAFSRWPTLGRTVRTGLIVPPDPRPYVTILTLHGFDASKREPILRVYDRYPMVGRKARRYVYLLLSGDFTSGLIRLTFASCRFIVFGKVKDGLEVIDKIEQVGSQSGKTAQTVVIKDCGEL